MPLLDLDPTRRHVYEKRIVCGENATLTFSDDRIFWRCPDGHEEPCEGHEAMMFRAGIHFAILESGRLFEKRVVEMGI